MALLRAMQRNFNTTGMTLEKLNEETADAARLLGVGTKARTAHATSAVDVLVRTVSAGALTSLADYGTAWRKFHRRASVLRDVYGQAVQTAFSILNEKPQRECFWRMLLSAWARHARPAQYIDAFVETLRLEMVGEYVRVEEAVYTCAHSLVVIANEAGIDAPLECALQAMHAQAAGCIAARRGADVAAYISAFDEMMGRARACVRALFNTKTSEQFCEKTMRAAGAEHATLCNDALRAALASAPIGNASSLCGFMLCTGLGESMIATAAAALGARAAAHLARGVDAALDVLVDDLRATRALLPYHAQAAVDRALGAVLVPHARALHTAIVAKIDACFRNSRETGRAPADYVSLAVVVGDLDVFGVFYVRALTARLLTPHSGSDARGIAATEDEQAALAPHATALSGTDIMTTVNARLTHFAAADDLRGQMAQMMEWQAKFDAERAHTRAGVGNHSLLVLPVLSGMNAWFDDRVYHWPAAVRAIHEQLEANYHLIRHYGGAQTACRAELLRAAAAPDLPDEHRRLIDARLTAFAATGDNAASTPTEPTRTLVFSAAAANAEIEVVGAKSTITLALTGLQALVVMELLRVGAAPEQSADEIAAATGIEAKHVRRILQELRETKIAASKTATNRLIVHTNPEDKNSRVRFNRDFEATRRRTNVPQARMITSADPKTDDQHIAETRKLAIKAVVVRIMKARTRLAHNALIADVTAHLQRRFTVPIQAIKIAIEQLIQEEYMERDPNDRSVYLYLA